VTSARKTRPRARPLDESRLEELALAYVGRFATTRGKLSDYLARKLRERGWEGSGNPDTAAIADRLAGQGYIDDAGYALSRARSLSARGYGRRRVAQSLRSAGIAEDDGRDALQLAIAGTLDAAMKFAERRRIGPFAPSGAVDPRTRERWIAAMIRAGHEFEVAKELAKLPGGVPLDREELARKLRLDDA